MTEKAIVITTDDKIEVRDLEVKDGSLLEPLQQIVSGYIEIVHPMRLCDGPVPLAMIVNEEGIIEGLPINAIASVLYGADIHGSFIHGNVAILEQGERDGDPDIVGLSPYVCECLSTWFKTSFHIIKN